MAKRIYRVGELCDYCKTPTIQGKDGNGYCWPGWAKWKESKSFPQATQAPPRPETPSSEHQVALKTYLMKLETRVKALELKIDVLESWKDKQPVFADIDGKQVQVPNCFN